MKNILFTISFLFIVNIITINVANCQVAASDAKQTEKKMDCGKAPKAKCCSMMADTKDAAAPKSKSMSCDSTKCKGKCDMTKCKSASEGNTAQKKDCDPSKCKMTSKN